MAAGFVINKSKINQIKDSFFEYMLDKDSNLLKDKNRGIDGELLLKDINFDMIQFFKKFRPYGSKNNDPIFVTKDVKLVDKPDILGKNKDSIKFKVKQDNKIFNAIGFGLINEFEKLITKNKLNIEYTIIYHSNNFLLNILGVK